MVGWFRERRRKKVAARPTPPEWVAILEQGFPPWRHYDESGRERFLDMLDVFVAEKRFVGAGGLEVTDEMRVIVGACAVRLVMGLGIGRYDHLTEIVLYPYDEIIDPRGGDHLLGAAHVHGAIVLSWPTVKRGLRAPHDGRDTAAHEFAHSLDLGSGAMNGAPPLRASEHYRAWATVLGHHYEAVAGGNDVLRPYGGTAPAEFFAVATEEYFERPDRLRDKAPALFRELDRFYRGPE